MHKILAVCLGNICRSPAGEGVLKARANARNLHVKIDSAGTGAWHVGNPPDPRMIKTAARRNIDISAQRARQVDTADFYQFDTILAMDQSNFDDLMQMAPHNREANIHLFLDFAGGDTREMPDPYYGKADGFEHVLDLVERGADGFLDHLEKKLK